MSRIERSSLLQPCHASPHAERGEGSGQGQGGRGLRPPATGVLGTAWILKASLPHSVVYAGSSKVVGAFTPWKWADAANLGFGIFLDFFRFCCCCCCHPFISTPMTAAGRSLLSCFLQRHPCPVSWGWWPAPARLLGGLPGTQTRNRRRRKGRDTRFWGACLRPPGTSRTKTRAFVYD